MLAGLLIPGKPIGNMYFAAWSHNVIANAVNLSNDLKLGEYRKSIILENPLFPYSQVQTRGTWCGIGHHIRSYTTGLKQRLMRICVLVKVPPRVMVVTQVWGTVLGGFINYAVMISVVNGNRELLVDGNGDSSWSGATMQVCCRHTLLLSIACMQIHDC